MPRGGPEVCSYSEVVVDPHCRLHFFVNLVLVTSSESHPESSSTMPACFGNFCTTTYKIIKNLSLIHCEYSF